MRCHRRARQGEDPQGCSEQGLKDRPCVIIHTVETAYRETEVYIAPITHTTPKRPERAMEIPNATKARLRLDAKSSWIIITESRIDSSGRGRTSASCRVAGERTGCCLHLANANNDANPGLNRGQRRAPPDEPARGGSRSR